MKISKQTQIEYTITMSEDDALIILNGLGSLNYNELSQLANNSYFGSVMNDLYDTLVSKIKRGSILKDE